MDYRLLGCSGIKVSSVGLGVMTFGSQVGKKEAFEQLDTAYEAGITLYDTAENYPAPVDANTQGASEKILGNWAKARGVRDEIVIASKVAGPGNDPGDMTHLRGDQRCLDSKNIEIRGVVNILDIDSIPVQIILKNRNFFIFLKLLNN